MNRFIYERLVSAIRPSTRPLAQTHLQAHFFSCSARRTQLVLDQRASSSLRSLLSKRAFSSSSRSTFSSSLLRGARTNWYKDSTGRPIQTFNVGPVQRLQRWINRKIPASYLFYGIIGANVVVFGAWYYANETAKRFRDFGPLTFMYKNFACSWANIARPWTLLTSCFSHIDPAHIFVNLFSFYTFGQSIFALLTSSQFIGLYFVAGLAGNAVQLIANAFQSTDVQSLARPALGASGAISGVLAFFAMAYPRNPILLFFVIPMPTWVACSGIVAYDMYLALKHPNGGVAAAAHLGGFGAGVLYFLRLRRGGLRFY